MKIQNFKAVIEEWLEFHRAKVKFNTYIMYQRYSKNLILEFGEQNIIDIKPINVQRFFNNLFSIGYAKSTIEKYRLTLSQAFNYAISIDLLIKNPCSDTFVPKGAKVKKVTCVDDRSVEVILKSYDKPFGLFALFLMTFGLRRSEALALTWEDFHLTERFLSVNKIIEFDKSTPIVCNYLKNGDEERIIPILPNVYNIICDKKQSGIIFSREGDYLKRSRMEKEWKKYLNATNLDINKHQLRHTYATLLYKAGVDMKTAMELLGHRNISMLMKVYTHTDMEVLQHSVANLSSYISHKFENL